MGDGSRRGGELLERCCGLLERGVGVACCGTCCRARGVVRRPHGVTLATIHDLAEAVVRCERTLSF